MGSNEYGKEVLNSVRYYQYELNKVGTILNGETMPGREESHRELIVAMKMAGNVVQDVLNDLETLEDMTRDQLS